MNELLEFLLFHSDSYRKLHFYNLIGLSKYKDWLDGRYLVSFGNGNNKLKDFLLYFYC
jgi:hypothetical protein